MKETQNRPQEFREQLRQPAFSVTIIGDATSGKTTLLNQLETTGFTVRPEPDNPVFELYRKNPEKYAFHNQLYKMTQLMGQELIGQESDTNSSPYFNESGVLATDVYNRYLHDIGLMTDEQFRVLNDLYTHYLDTMHKPDLVVYLHADDDIIRMRQLRREGVITHDPAQLQPYWDRLVESLGRRGIPVVKIDTGGVSVEETQSSLLSQTERMKGTKAEPEGGNRTKHQETERQETERPESETNRDATVRPAQRRQDERQMNEEQPEEESGNGRQMIMELETIYVSATLRHAPETQDAVPQEQES